MNVSLKGDIPNVYEMAVINTGTTRTVSVLTVLFFFEFPSGHKVKIPFNTLIVIGLAGESNLTSLTPVTE